MSTSVQYTSAGQQGPFVYSSIELIEGVGTSRQISVFVNGEIKTEGIDYQLDEGQQAVYFNFPYPEAGHTIVLRRVLSTDRLYSYQNGDSLSAHDLNANYDHLRLLTENMTDFGNDPLPTRKADNLFELKDVDQSSIPNDGDILQWNEDDAIWRAAPLQLKLADLSDVNSSLNPNDMDALVYYSGLWRTWEFQDFRPTEQNVLWGTSNYSVGFVERPSVSAQALSARGPLANEIPTVRDIDDMLSEVQDVNGREVGKRVDAAMSLLDETALEAAMLSAVEWKYGIRFASWRDYENATKDWPALNGPVNYGDTLPDGSEAIIRTSETQHVTESSGPTFIKNPNRRFAPTKMFGRIAGSFTLDPGAYISYPSYTGTVATDSMWIRNVGGLIDEIRVNGWRVNPSGDHILQVTINLECAQSTQAIRIINDKHGLMPVISDYSGTLGYMGVYNIFPQGFTMNVPTGWFAFGNNAYEPIHFRVYGDRSLEASVNTTTTTV